MPEPGPAAQNHCVVVPNRQGRKIQKEERYSKDWKNVCFIGYETRRRMCPHIQEARSGSHTTVVAGTHKAATKVLALKKQKLLSRNIATKESIREEWKQCQKVKKVQEGTGSQNQISKSRVLRTTYPNHGHIKTYDENEDQEDHLKIFQAAAKMERWAMPTWYHMFNSTLIGNSRVWFDDLPKESIDSYDDLRKAFLENYLQQKKCIKDPIEIHNIKQRDGESMKEFVWRNKAKPWKRPGKDNKKGGNLKERQTVGNINGEEDETEGPMIIEAKIGGHCVHRMYVDGGSSSEILYEYCFSKFRPEIKNQLIHANTPLVGFSGEIIWPLGSPSPYNGIIGRPGVRKIQAIPSTAHGMLKFPVAGGIVTLRSSRIIPLECSMVSKPGVSRGRTKRAVGLLRRHLDVFVSKPADMTGVSRHIAEHRLNVREGCLPVRQKKRGQGPERNKAINEEVKKLVEADIMKEVHYHSWLSNPVMVKKHDDIWRMCVDFKDLNKTFPKDGYPLPKIDWKVESLCGYLYKCFLDAYKGYHQIEMAEEDEEKTIGQNLEVYVDDLVIKSRTEKEVIRDIEETFKTLREINIKLNPKNCAFGMGEGTFLGYKVDADGLRVCRDKVEAVLDLPSPKCLKDVQKLNGKLASLNRFLSKSAERSLPFFKMLKKCTKKCDLQWTAEAEMTFKGMKQLIAELPMLMAPKEKEELIMYLAATKEAINTVLMTKRNGKQVPIYFVSRALQGPEINYTPMEKLILALVTGRLLKWRFKLGEHDIQYRPKTSVKGQIMSDFIVECPEDDTPDTSMKDREELPDPCILFTDGSSCIDGSGVGLIITNSKGMEFTYALRFRFNTTNNEAEYETLIAGLRVAGQMGVQNLQENMDSKLIANQVNGIYIAKESSMIKYLEKVKKPG
nr:reverse transcriptase domain-containing protein [Tanacetum cinerariifolium]